MKKAVSMELLEPVVNEEIVKSLENLLEKAKKGEILSFGAAYVTQERHLCNISYWNRDVDGVTLVGGIEVLKGHIMSNSLVVWEKEG